MSEEYKLDYTGDQIAEALTKVNEGLKDISSITYGTESLTAGSSALETGKLYLVYE